jgi:hypothetical protein
LAEHGARTIFLLAMAGSATAAAPDVGELGYNRHHYTLRMDQFDMVLGGWRGGVRFEISACPQPACFHLGGRAFLPINRATGGNEGFFQIPGMSCDLHFEEVAYDDMDSGDWRVTPVARNQAKHGCAGLPAALAGVYKQPPFRPAVRHRKG